MMFSFRDEPLISSTRNTSGLPTGAWLYLGAEFVIGALLAVLLAALTVVKSLLPKPPRDLNGEIVVVTGAASGLGKAIAEEFSENGCVVVCVDNDLESAEGTASQLSSQYPRIERIGPEHRKHQTPNAKTSFAYECDLADRSDILRLAKKIGHEVGQVDVLVTCSGNGGQDILDAVGFTLMSHYWTVLAFLPSMLLRRKAHIVGITPTTSTHDAYMGSRAAVAGLMEALGQEFSNGCSGQLSFITVAPNAEPRLLKQSEQQTAKDVVLAVRRDQCRLTMSWSSRMFYSFGCMVHGVINGFTRWLYSHGCGHPF